jgi:hypothetical protein
MNQNAKQSEKEQIEKVIKAMKVRGFEAMYAENREEAKKMVLGLVPENWIVGGGDSATIRSLGVLDELATLGNRLLYYHVFPKVLRKNPAIMPKRVGKQNVFGSDIFLLSANAVTLDGRIVNADGGGMRVAGGFFGPEIIIYVVGRNKIVKDAEEGFKRIREVIGPVHHRTNRRENPPESYLPIDPAKCLAENRQMEPGAPRWDYTQRLTPGNMVVVLEGTPGYKETKIIVIMVNEDLGLGWDPRWPQERKDKIFLEYQKYTPPHRPTAMSTDNK